MSACQPLAGNITEPPIFTLAADERGWYAAYTRSNFEKRVAAELQLQGVDAYLPVLREVHRWKDRYKEVEIPVFPGYVFVRIDGCDASQLPVLRTPGVVQILGSGGRIERIREAEIEAIRQLTAANVPFSRHPFLREGARVRVKRGPLRGLEGILIRVKNIARLVLSVNLLSQSVATEIDACDVEVI